MPLQQLAPQPAVTGLGDLGGVLQEAARGYATEKRQDQLLAQRRGQQLQDVREERSYQDARDQTQRMNRLADTETELKFRAKQAMIASLRNEGLLQPGQENDEAAIATAYKEFQSRGLDKLYDEMLHTPGPDGQPLLNPADVGDHEKVQAAKVAYGQHKAAIIQRDIGVKERTIAGGQAAADRALNTEKDLNKQIDSLTTELNKPTPQPSRDEVVNRAREMWIENHPGEKVAPTDPSKLGAELQSATKELQTSRFLGAKERHDQIQQQIFLLRQQLVSQTTESGGLGKMGFFANPATPAPPPPTGMGLQDNFQPLSKPSGPDEFTNFVKRTAPPPPAAGNVLANPTNNPTIARGNEAMANQQKAQAAATLNDVKQEVVQLKTQLANVASTVSNAPVGAMGGGMIPYRQPDPIVAGQQASNLLKKIAMTEARQRELEAMIQGPYVMPPAINTPTASTPALSFASPGSMSPLTTDWWKAPAQ